MANENIKQVIFDPEQHKYFIPQDEGMFPGFELVSVSRVLASCDMYGYAKTQRNVEAMNFGTHVHKLTHLCDEGIISSEEVTDEKERGHLIAYERFRDDLKFIPSVMERPMYHGKYLYAGTADKYGVSVLGGDEIRTLVEIKTGKPHPAHLIQVAAYKEMFSFNDLQIDKTFLVYLAKDGDYRIIEAENHLADLHTFLSALNVWRWKTKNKIGKEE